MEGGDRRFRLCFEKGHRRSRLFDGRVPRRTWAATGCSRASNFESNPKAGLVFMIPGMEVTARVNGRVRVVEPAELEIMVVEPEVQWTDDNTRLIQGLLLTVDEAYFHCPRAFKVADLWNPSTIEANASLSLKDL